MAKSDEPGPGGISGPYSDIGIIMEPEPESDEWEGLQGTDSFYPFKVNNSWMAFYGSAKTEKLPIKFWGVGLAASEKLQGPWKRLSDRNSTDFNEVFAENPILTRLGDGTYIAVMDALGEGFGYSLSYNGLDWSEMYHIAVTDRIDPWWAEFRTPLCFIEEADGLFGVFFTATKEYTD